jgi:hypothetical protein
MKRMLIWLAIIAGLAVAYFIAYPFTLLSYRLTFEVETPEGLKTGSGVIRLAFHQEPWLMQPSCGAQGVSRGEAVTVDLGPRGTFYALLIGRTNANEPDQGLSPARMLSKTLAPQIWEMKPCDNAQIFTLMFLDAKANVPSRLIPFLVRFRDEKDPSTIEAVDPENLAASFGEGVTLKRVVIETTSDPVTTGIERRLEWLVDGSLKPRWVLLLPGQQDILSSDNWRKAR